MKPESLPGSFFGPPDLVELLRNRQRHLGDHVGYRYLEYLVDGKVEETVLTFGELDRRARAIAAWLEANNLRGERAVLLLPNGVDFVAAFFGCLYAGVVAVTAYPPRRNRSLDRVQAIVDDCGARVAVTTVEVHKRVQSDLHLTPALADIPWLAIDELPDGIESAWNPIEIDGRETCFLQYTSGSTGVPKGVMLSHHNLLHNSAVIGHLFEHTRSNTGVSWLPVYHDMGLIGGVLQALFVGRPVVLMSPISFLQRPLRWLQTISKYRASTGVAPNFAYDLCVDRISPEEREGLDLSCWRVAANGAEPVRADTMERFVGAFADCGFRREAFYPCYGLAEASLIATGGEVHAAPVVRGFSATALETETRAIACDDGDEDTRRLVGSGRAIQDQRVEVVDPQTAVRVEPGHIGEIWIQGPSVAKGYWNRRDETEKVFHAHLQDSGEGPFLRTGDLGFMVDDELFVTGRLKDLIIVRGVNHYPQDVEHTIEASHPAVHRGAGAVFAFEADSESRLAAVYELRRNGKHPTDDVIGAIRREVSRVHDLQLDAVVLLRTGRVPKTSSGKIQRRACRDDYLSGAMKPVAQWQSPALLAATDFKPAAEPKNVTIPRTAKPSDGRSPAEPVLGKTTQPEVDDLRPMQAASTVDSVDGSAGSAPVSDLANESLAYDAVFDVVVNFIRQLTQVHDLPVSGGSSLSDMGLDSLQRIELQAMLEDRFGGHIPPEEAVAIDTVGEVCGTVVAHLGGESMAGTRCESIRSIPSDWYQFDAFPEYRALCKQLALEDQAGVRNPFFTTHETVTRDTTVIDGRELVNFCSYNYLGMSGDPEVTQAAQEAVARYGTSVSASRLVSGQKPIHLELESAIAEFVGAEMALTFVGGHATNETVLGHLLGPQDLIVHDALAHNSIIQGGVLSGARRRSFPHNDAAALDRILRDVRTQFRRVLIAVEGVYSMDGDIAELPALLEVKRRYKALLFVDEAHSAGVLGATGRGVAEHFGINAQDVDVWMGTLSKSYASCGGYIAGSAALVEYLKYTTPGFLFSVGMPPAAAAAALAAIRVLRREPERVSAVQSRSALFLELARTGRLNVGLSNGTPIVPIILGDSLLAVRLSEALFERGINVQPIMYPAVEEAAARLRFFMTSCHSESQIRETVAAIVEELERLRPSHIPRPHGTPAGRGVSTKA